MAKVLLCALLEDNGRALFLEKREGELVRYGIPCTIADEKENPVEKLKETILQQTGIDAMVGNVVLTGRHNLGSRKRKQWAGALAFKVTAKSYSTRTPSKWVKLADAAKLKLDRQSEWIRNTK